MRSQSVKQRYGVNAVKDATEFGYAWRLKSATLLHYDGAQIFEGRDLIGSHYIAALANDDNGVDTYAVVGTSPESLRRFRDGAIDLKSLMLEMPDGQWYTAQPEDGESVKIRLQPQAAPLAESDFLPDDGLVLYDDADSVGSRGHWERRNRA